LEISLNFTSIAPLKDRSPNGGGPLTKRGIIKIIPLAVSFIYRSVINYRFLIKKIHFGYYQEIGMALCGKEVQPR
jgi:hypothetical protein